MATSLPQRVAALEALAGRAAVAAVLDAAEGLAPGEAVRVRVGERWALVAAPEPLPAPSAPAEDADAATARADALAPRRDAAPGTRCARFG